MTESAANQAAKNENPTKLPIGTFQLLGLTGQIPSGIIMRKDLVNELELCPEKSIKMQRTTMQLIARKINNGKHKKHIVFRTMGSENDCHAFIEPRKVPKQIDEDVFAYVTTKMNDVIKMTLIE